MLVEAANAMGRDADGELYGDSNCGQREQSEELHGCGKIIWNL